MACRKHCDTESTHDGFKIRKSHVGAASGRAHALERERRLVGCECDFYLLHGLLPRYFIVRDPTFLLQEFHKIFFDTRPRGAAGSSVCFLRIADASEEIADGVVDDSGHKGTSYWLLVFSY